MTHFAFNNFLNVSAKITTNLGGAKLNIKGAMHTGQGDINAGVKGIFWYCKFIYLVYTYHHGNIFFQQPMDGTIYSLHVLALHCRCNCCDLKLYWSKNSLSESEQSSTFHEKISLKCDTSLSMLRSR